MDHYEQLIAAGAENVHPLFTGEVVGENGEKKRVVVANAIDGAVYLTDEGREFLKQAGTKQAGAAKSQTGRKSSKLAPESTPEPVVILTDKESDELTDV